MGAYRKQRAGEERAAERELIARAMKGDEDAASELEVEQSPWNEWSCPRDGLQWWPEATDKDMRK